MAGVEGPIFIANEHDRGVSRGASHRRDFSGKEPGGVSPEVCLR